MCVKGGEIERDKKKGAKRTESRGISPKVEK
jgi:hypothetical protein